MDGWMGRRAGVGIAGEREEKEEEEEEERERGGEWTDDDAMLRAARSPSLARSFRLDE